MKVKGQVGEDEVEETISFVDKIGEKVEEQKQSEVGYNFLKN